MPSYMFSFRLPSDFTQSPEGREAWNEFFGGISPHLEELGNPIFSRQSVGETGADTVLGGYSLITAATLDEACVLAAGCPLINNGGGVEVGEITPLAEEVVASRMAGASARA